MVSELNIVIIMADAPRKDSVYSLATLESKLVSYVNDKNAQADAFDIASVPKVSKAQAQKEAAREWGSWLR